jgi:SAM-dependent methyltransferase
MSTSDWAGYLDDFHTRHPGITAQVLRRARCADGHAYDWLAAAIPLSSGLLLDLACGDGPLWPYIGGRRCLGVDRSIAELAAAHTRGADLLACASATALPLPDGSVDTVACSMAVQILTPLPAVLTEISRVLRPGGLLVATVPTNRPLRAGDLPMLAGLLAALGRSLGYPNDHALAHPAGLLADAGLRLLADERRRFLYPLRGAGAADLFLTSLYVPGLTGRRRHAAATYLRALACLHVSLPVPIRRIIAVRR